MSHQINKRPLLICIGILTLGITTGYLLGQQYINTSSHHNISTSTHQVISKSTHQINPSANQSIITSTHQHIKSSAHQYTCSMHPQIRQSEPGQCPICGMDLIPLKHSDEVGLDPNAIRMSETAMKLANVQTMVVGSQKPSKALLLQGKISVDERLVFSQTAHLSGRIERLLLNHTGAEVERGQIMAYLYSPELITAQRELFEAYSLKGSTPELLKLAKEKLKNWKLTEDQIQRIIQNGRPIEQFPILSDHTGTVLSKSVQLGEHVKEGTLLYKIADLSKLWVLFEVHEKDLPWVHVNDKVTFTLQALPGEHFKGVVSFIDPVIDRKARVAKARVEIINRGLKIKPEMFAHGTLNSTLDDDQIVVPKTAIMWTGKRSVVYVKHKRLQGIHFTMREVVLGPSLGNAFVIKSGLKEDEEIAINGTFSIDAAAQLAGKPSMMNREGHTVMTGHHHGDSETKPSEVKHQRFKVFGNCGMCQERIETAAKSLDGVYTAKWNMDTKDMQVSFNPQKVNLKTIHKVIAKAGHDTEEVQAPDQTYHELPGCCQYERPQHQ